MGSATYRRRRPEETLLHQVVRENLATFLELADDRAREGRSLPRYVRNAFDNFLDCGVLAKGFVRVRCPSCGYDTAVGFSCKERGLCPSCTGRRMDEVAANLVDRVFPEVPVRQWVLSMPHDVRFYLAKDASLLTGVLKIFIDEIFRDYRRRARSGPKRDVLCGGVTAVQRFGGALNLNVHFHSLLLDGVYVREEGGRLRFQRLPDPSTENVERLAWVLREKILRYLAKKGCYFRGRTEAEAVAEVDVEASLLDAVQAASIREWVALSDPPKRVSTAGERVEDWGLPSEKPLCGRAEGFTLHAAVEIGGRDRKGLEQVCRYILRPPFSANRLERLSDGRVAYGFRKPRPDGTTHVVLEPLELMEKLAALVPPPRAHLVRYHGVLAPHGGDRRRVVPAPPRAEECAHVESRAETPRTSRPSEAPAPLPRPEREAPPAPATPTRQAEAPERPPPPVADTVTPASSTEPECRPARWDWASLMKRGLDLDVLSCPRCGDRMKVLAAIEDPDVIPRMLESMGLPSTWPARASARPQRQRGFEFDQS